MAGFRPVAGVAQYKYDCRGWGLNWEGPDVSAESTRAMSADNLDGVPIDAYAESAHAYAGLSS